MSKDHITPAVTLQEEMPNEMSAAEFQQRLYGWFEDRGLLSELRAHLRKQMIGALKDTAIGRTVGGQQKQAISPKLQALNLLIAEFLLHQDYHYSLSVFSTEVPLISVLPEFPPLAVNNLENRAVSKKWQFSEKDMWDILETLGVTQGTEEGQNIYGSYYNTINKEPLLICIVRMLHFMQNKFRSNLCQIKEVEPKAMPSSSTLVTTGTEWKKHVAQILSSSNINQNINEVLNILIDIVDNEKKRLETESKEKYLKLQMKLQAHAEQQEKEQQKKWSQLSDSLRFEKTNMNTEKKRQQMEMDNLKTKLQRHQSVLRDRYQQVVAREGDVSEREHQLRLREGTLGRLQQNLQADFESLRREQATAGELQEMLKNELSEKQAAARTDAEFLKTLQVECSNMKTQISTTQEAVLNGSRNETGGSLEHDAEQALVKNLIKQLRVENMSLKSVNTEQQRRIDELSRRAAALMGDLENTQATVNFLSSNRNLGAGTLSAPPLVAPPGAVLTHHHTNGVNTYTSGGGEDGLRALPAPPREYRHFPSPRDVKRRTPPRRLTVHSSSGSDDNTPSKEVLEEARDRLRRLEQESNEVDRQYRQFSVRRTEEGRFSTSQHFYHSPFVHSPWISVFNREYEPLARQETDYAFPPFQNVPSDLLNQASSLPGPSSPNVSRRRISKYPPNNSEASSYRFPPRIPFEAGKKDATHHFNLSKYLKQTNNLTLSQNVVRDSGPMHHSYGTEPHQNDQKSENPERDDSSSASQSVASSGVLEDMLAAGTSGVSGISGLETTDRSESQPSSHTE